MKKISFSGFLKIILLIVISLVYIGQVYAADPLPTADSIVIRVREGTSSGTILYSKQCPTTNTCELMVGSDSVQPPIEVCITEGSKYLQAGSKCVSGLDVGQVYTRGYGTIYTVDWDNDPLDCACIGGTWIDSATSCGSYPCPGGQCCGDDGPIDDFSGSGTWECCINGDYHTDGDVHRLCCQAYEGDTDGCSNGDTNCWMPFQSNCCGDDGGIEDTWCGGPPAGACIDGVYRENIDGYEYLCEQCNGYTWIDGASGTGASCCGDDRGDDDFSGATGTWDCCVNGNYHNDGDYHYVCCEAYEGDTDGCSNGDTNCWMTIPSKCCGDDGGIDDTWCGSVPDGACVDGTYWSAAASIDDYPEVCKCIIDGYPLSDNCETNGEAGCWDETGCCYEDSDDWCDGTNACHDGVWYSDPASDSAACNCFNGKGWDAVDCQSLPDGTPDCWAIEKGDCCYDTDDTWCDGTAGACAAGVYRTDSETSQEACQCKGGYIDYYGVCSEGDSNCWAPFIGYCCDGTDNVCDGTAGACVGGTYRTSPSYGGVCNCLGGHAYTDTCDILPEGTEGCWAASATDCCDDLSDNWCDGQLGVRGALGACIDGKYYSLAENRQETCQCKGGYLPDDTCFLAGQSSCWASDAAGGTGDCCYEGDDDWCDGTSGACVAGIYQNDGDTSPEVCGCLTVGVIAADICDYDGEAGCWDETACCYEASDDWCDGTNACHDGVWYNEPSSDSAACNCFNGKDWFASDCSSGAQDCWASNAGDCCYDTDDTWCDGQLGACYEGTYQTTPSNSAACNCQGSHDPLATCDSLPDGTPDCWASDAAGGTGDCCYDTNDDWCDGTSGACVDGVYQTDSETSQQACQCKGEHSYSGTCSEGQTGCWEKYGGSMNCCDGTDTVCDGTGNYAACINGFYRTEGDYDQTVCSCGGGYWDIGGEAISSPDNLCCEDDSFEEMLTRDAHSSMDNGYIADPTDDACCSAANDCVDDSVCYNSGPTAHDADDDGDVDYCNSGIWYDCFSDIQCQDGYQCANYNCVACIPGTCGAGCVGHDSDGDGLIDDCDIEGSDDSIMGIQDKSYYNEPVDEECNDGVDNDGNAGCDSDGCLCTMDNNYCGSGNHLLIELDPNIGCTCTTCEECGGTWWDLNLCDEAECQGCTGNCHFDEIIPGVSGSCCTDSDLDGVCDDAPDICPGHNDSADADGDTKPDGCDKCGAESDCPDQDCSNDDDNDCSPDNVDCYPGDPTKGDGDLSGETESCGTDDCYGGTYYKFTDAEIYCINGDFVWNCSPAEFPYIETDLDGDGYDNFCDYDDNNPCTKEYPGGDNCDFEGCLDDTEDCTNSCPGPDADSDGIPDDCDIYGDDRDNDGTPDSFDCFPDDSLIGEGDPCPTTMFCGDDGCREGSYFDFTDCVEICGNLTDGVCGCECSPAALPYDGLDADNDGYDDYCDNYPNDPCSKVTQRDNCSTDVCMDDLTNFCNNACKGPDSDGDNVTDICDSYPGDPCSIALPEDNCGRPGCLEKSNVYCNNCSSLNDADGDNIIDLCDTENTLLDCTDSIDNDGDGTCDELGCNGMDPDQGCAELCESCEECGAGAFDFCGQTECESCGSNCHYSFGLGLFNDCCIDSDSDTVCDIYDLCPDKDDRIDADGDGMPNACDYCENEPALTVPSEVEEITCIDGIDNDCDGSTDTNDDDCQCPLGTMMCSDGVCSVECEEPLACNNNSVCDAIESCDCADCYFEQGSCSQGAICDPETGLCSSEPDLSTELCESYDPSTDQGTCNVGERNCWASEIPLDYIIVGDTRCCGDDPEETWMYKSNIDLEHVLVEYTCYNGEWRSLREVGITYYDVGVE
ncbi:hypothetical protein KY361_03565 [Candidatus Woesearchaeota archaeon]|nr:hypothetical protein [Candidatus Woesearchaeota archaeon]